MLLVVALLALIIGLTAPLALSALLANDLDSASQLTASSLRRAENLAAAGANDSAWGVHMENQTATIFAGQNFALRNTDQDETVLLPQSASFATTTEIIFNKLSGEPPAAATVTLTNPIHQNRDITINTAGLIHD